MVIFLFSFKTNAQEIPTLENFTLKNGLKIYFIKYGKIEAVNINLIINSGKKNEVPGQQGYNDIVANIILEGNKQFTQDQQNDSVFALGSELKVSSNFDYTSISGNFLSKDATLAFSLLSAAIQQPLFNKEQISQYISYLTDYNNPSKMDISQLADVYSNLSIYGIDNPLGRTIYKKQLQLITPEKLIEFHKFNYTPKNTKIIVCGNFNSNLIKQIIENSFNTWQSSFGETNGVSLDYPKIKQQEIYFTNKTSATQCALQWNKIAPAAKDKNFLAFTIANQLFNKLLFKEIREIGGKTYGISSIHQKSQFSNLLNISCSVRNSEVQSTINLFDKTLQKFTLVNFTQQEFDNEITQYKTNLLSAEYPEEIANFYNPLMYDFDERKTVLTQLSNLKVDDVKNSIAKYFTPNVYKLVIVGDEIEIKSQLEQIKNLKKFTIKDLE